MGEGSDGPQQPPPTGLARRPVSGVVAAPEGGNHLRCPRCGQIDRVQRVSAVVEGGTTTGTFAGPSVGLGTVPGRDGVAVTGGFTTLDGTTESALAARLRYPRASIYESPWGLFSIGAVALGGLCIFSGLISALASATISSDTNPVGNALGSLLIFVALPCALLVYLVRAKSATAAERRRADARYRPNWAAGRLRWQDLSYCHRCDGVFAPRPDATFVPTDRIWAYVFNRDEYAWQEAARYWDAPPPA